jgi:serine/threonine-protein kinase
MRGRYWRVMPVRPLAQGGMATVWLARVFPSPRVVVVKLLLPRHFSNAHVHARFLLEGRILGALRGTGTVPRTRGISPINERACPWYAMDYLHDMKRLRDLVGGETHLRLERRRAFKVGAALCECVHRIHCAHVIHRDLSPENVMVAFGRDGHVRVVLIDFDSARPLVRMPELEGLALAGGGGAIIGKTNYTSPEQWQDFDRADQRSDAYAVGIMLYECLTGEIPFPGTDLAAVRELHRSALRGPARRILVASGVSERLTGAVAGLFAREPDQRPGLDAVKTLLLHEAVGVTI